MRDLISVLENKRIIAMIFIFYQSSISSSNKSFVSDLVWIQRGINLKVLVKIALKLQTRVGVVQSLCRQWRSSRGHQGAMAATP